ncbi:MAG: hypothetical protein SNJ72_03530 [Fimbriimonadales bacterium]
MRRNAGKVHWTIWLFGLLLLAFAGISLVPLISQLTKPAYLRTATEFIVAVQQNKLSEAEKLLDKEALPEEKRNLKQVVDMANYRWGRIEKVELIDVVDNPGELKHPKASEAKRVEFHLQCYLSPGYASVYLVPANGEWKIVDYILQ